YLKANKANFKTRLKLYEKTAKSYDRMTATVADSLATQFFTNREEQELELEAYYKKVKAATNAVLAFEFYQAEVYLLTQMRIQIMAQIPTYGAFHKAVNQKPR